MSEGKHHPGCGKVPEPITELGQIARLCSLIHFFFLIIFIFVVVVFSVIGHDGLLRQLPSSALLTA